MANASQFPTTKQSSTKNYPIPLRSIETTIFKNTTQTLKPTNIETPLPIIAALHPNSQKLNNHPPETL